VVNAKSQKIIGDGKKVVALEYLDRKSEKVELLNLDGVFVQIGLLPNTHFLKGLVELTPSGEIKIDDRGRTSVPGIYAAAAFRPCTISAGLCAFPPSMGR
jgi:alkyl hydroperoxide reductase subunit F